MKIRRRSVVLLVFVGWVFGLGVTWVYRDSISRSILQWTANRYYPPLNGTLRIGKCSWGPSWKLTLYQVEGKIGGPGSAARFSCRQITVASVQNALRSKQISAVFEEISVQMEDTRIEGMDLSLKNWPWNSIPDGPRKIGSLVARSTQVGQAEIQSITADVWQLQDGYRLESLEGKILSGTLRGNLTYRPFPDEKPALVFDVRLDNLSLSELSVFNPELFQGASGLASGTLAFAGFADGNFQLSFNFQSQGPGGQVQAPFFNTVLPYLPSNIEGVQKLRDDVSQGKAIHFKSALTRLDTTQPGELKALLMMTLPEYTVDLNVDFTIRLGNETAFSQIVQLWKRLKTNAS